MEVELGSKEIKYEEKLFHLVNVHTCVINADVKDELQVYIGVVVGVYI